MKMLALVVLLAGCEVSASSEPWTIRAGLPPQPIARADIGLDDVADVGVGDAWISLHDYGAGDVSYPIVGVPGGGLAIESVFDPTRRMSHGQLQTTTRFSRGTEPANQRDDRQYATIFVDVELAPRLLPHASGTLAATGMATMQIELVVPVPGPCTIAPSVTVLGDAQGCFTDPVCSDSNTITQLDDGTYQVRTLRLAIDVLEQECYAAS